MKIKSFYSLSGLFVLFLMSSGFIKSEQKIENLDGGKTSFAEFLSHFEKVETPFEVNLKNQYRYEDQKAKRSASFKKSKARKSGSSTNRSVMKNFIPELKNGMFSRSGPPEVLPVARFYPNDKMIAVIYMTYHPFRSKRVSEYVLTLYDLKGKIIHKDKEENDEVNYRHDFQSGFNLAYNNYQSTGTFSIDEKGQIWKKSYKNLWKDNVKARGYQNNEIVGYDLKDTQVFKIQSNGLVEASKSYDVDDRASID